MMSQAQQSSAEETGTGVRRRWRHLAGWLAAWFVLATMLDYALSNSGPSTGDNWQVFVTLIYFVYTPAVLASLYLLIRVTKVVMRKLRPGVPTMAEAREAANRRAELSGQSPRI